MLADRAVRQTRVAHAHDPVLAVGGAGPGPVSTIASPSMPPVNSTQAPELSTQVCRQLLLPGRQALKLPPPWPRRGIQFSRIAQPS